MNEQLVLKNNLKMARLEKKLSQNQLAELVGVSRNTISSIETGQFNPTAKLALILCVALDKSLKTYSIFNQKLMKKSENRKKYDNMRTSCAQEVRMDILERCEVYQRDKILNIIEMSQQTYPDSIVLFGDSLINRFDAKKYFPDKEIINCGIDGATSQTLYLVLQNVLSMKPKQIIFLIGTNDLDDEHDFDLLDITFALYNQILLINQRLPECKIGIISPLPVDEQMKTRSRNNNSLIRLGAEFKNLENELEHVTYIDLFEKFIENGQLNCHYTSDGLHLSEQGYEVFAKELKKYLI